MAIPPAPRSCRCAAHRASELGAAVWPPKAGFVRTRPPPPSILRTAPADSGAIWPSMRQRRTLPTLGGHFRAVTRICDGSLNESFRRCPRRTPFSLPSAVRAGRISLAPPLRTAPACPGGGTARWVGTPSGRGPAGVHARAAGLDVRCRGLHRDRARRAASKHQGARASGRGSCGHVGRSSGERIIIGRSSVRGAARCHNTHHHRLRSCA